MTVLALFRGTRAQFTCPKHVSSDQRQRQNPWLLTHISLFSSHTNPPTCQLPTILFVEANLLLSLSVFPINGSNLSVFKLSSVQWLSRVLLFGNPWTAACQVSLSIGFSRQEYWSGLLFLSTGDLPNLGLNLCLLHCRQILYCLSHQGSPAFSPAPLKSIFPTAF